MNPCLLHKGFPLPDRGFNRSIKYPPKATRLDKLSHTKMCSYTLGGGLHLNPFDGLNSVSGGGNPYSSISQGGRR